MDESGRGIRPDTGTLDALIEAAIKRGKRRSNAKPGADMLLFLGNRHASFPDLVVQDPVLEPVDKLVWMAIMLKAKGTGSPAAFPSYNTLANIANVSSKATISRAIAILRITRWLTLCGPSRERNSRFRGNVFAVHDEPLPLVDVLHLDVGHMTFLRDSVEHHHARVRSLARAALDSIDEESDADLDSCAAESVLDRKIEATESVDKSGPRRLFAFSAKVMAELRSGPDRRHSLDHQGQNLNAVDKKVQNLYPQNLNAVCSCSSSYIYKTTTTTTQSLGSKKYRVAGEKGAPLIYPKRLVGDQRKLADRYLATVSAKSRQPILDELEGRFRAETKGMPPLYDEMSFLFSLCKALKNGAFKANLGIKVGEERDAREKARRESAGRAAHTPHNREEEMRKRIAAAKGPLAEIRQSLGMPNRSIEGDGADESS